MAISNRTRDKFYQYANTPYSESESQKQQRETAQRLANSQPQNVSNGYIQQMNDMYDRIAQNKGFAYDKATDKAYQQFADMYKQLGGLSMSATQQAADDLTAGYGSTYSPQVAVQTDNAYQSAVDSWLPEFYQAAQNEYDAKRQNDLSNYQAAIEAYRNIENSNLNRQNAWTDITGAAAGRSNQENAYAISRYTDDKDFWFNQYQKEQEAINQETETNSDRYWNDNKLKEDNRQFNAQLDSDKKENKRSEYWSMNEVNVSLAADKCDSFNDKKDNKGMKEYLKQQVKKGNITQYQADGLYKQYKYTAPKSRGGSSGGRRSSGGSKGTLNYSYTADDTKSNDDEVKNKNIYDKDGKLKSADDMKIGKGIIMQISSIRGDGTETHKDKNGDSVTSPGSETARSRNKLINKLLKEKTINNDQAEWLEKYYGL